MTGASRGRAGADPLRGLLTLFRERGFAGATVLRGIRGLRGQRSGPHGPHPPSVHGLPIVVEVVDTEERIQSVMAELDRMIGGGLITLERARVILYRPGELGERPEGGEA